MTWSRGPVEVRPIIETTNPDHFNKKSVLADKSVYREVLTSPTPSELWSDSLKSVSIQARYLTKTETFIVLKSSAFYINPSPISPSKLCADRAGHYPWVPLEPVALGPNRATFRPARTGSHDRDPGTARGPWQQKRGTPPLAVSHETHLLRVSIPFGKGDIALPLDQLIKSQQSSLYCFKYTPQTWSHAKRMLCKKASMLWITWTNQRRKKRELQNTVGNLYSISGHLRIGGSTFSNGFYLSDSLVLPLKTYSTDGLQKYNEWSFKWSGGSLIQLTRRNCGFSISFPQLISVR